MARHNRKCFIVKRRKNILKVLADIDNGKATYNHILEVLKSQGYRISEKELRNDCNLLRMLRLLEKVKNGVVITQKGRALVLNEKQTK